MATTVANILTSVGYDLKLSSTTLTSRTSELVNYMNRIIRNGITPTLVRFESDFGVKEWATAETQAYVRNYTLPADFLSFYHLYCVEQEHSGTIALRTSSTTFTLDSSATATDDAYNGMYIRGTSGAGDGSQGMITDYTSGRVATVNPSLGAGSSETFVIFQVPADEDELDQVELNRLFRDYSATTSEPEAYAIEQSATASSQTYLHLGHIPDSSEYVLYGHYYYWPAALSSSSDSLPYHPIFDETIRSYVTQMAMNRDEYDVRVEAALMQGIQQDVTSIIVSRTRGRPRPAISRLYGGRR